MVRKEEAMVEHTLQMCALRSAAGWYDEEAAKKPASDGRVDGRRGAPLRLVERLRAPRGTSSVSPLPPSHVDDTACEIDP